MSRLRACALVVAVATSLGAWSGTPAQAGPRAEVAPQPSALQSFPAIPADSVVEAYGVGIHTAYLNTPYADADAVAAAITGLGVRHVRDDLYLDNPGQYAAMATVVAAGARFDLIMGRPGGSATPADYVQTAAQLPAGTVESLEGVNEWDLFGPQDTVDGQPQWVPQARTWQQDLYAAARGNPATSSLPILSPALAFKQDYASLGDLSASADVANMHVYPGGAKPSSEISQTTAAVRQVVPSGPLVTSEAGYHNATAATGGHPGISEDAAAAYLPRLLLEHVGRGEQRMYSYELIDEFDDPDLTDPEAHFGLLRHDLTPKPAYTAMKNLLALLADPGPSLATTPLLASIDGYANIPGVRFLLTQKRDDSYVLLVWRDVTLGDPSWSPVTTTLRVADRSRLQVLEPSTSADPSATTKGTSIPLTLGGQVVAVRIDALEPPSAPDVRASAPKPHRITVRWSAAPDHGHPITRYRVEFRGLVRFVGPDTRRLTLRGLARGRAGRVSVSARNSDGWGPVGRSARVVVR